MKTQGLILLVVLLATRLANAQDTGASLLRRAYELRRDGHDEEALPLLQQAYAVDPSPRVAAQLALAEQATASWQAASEHLRVALAAPNDPWIARHLDALEGAYALVLARLPREVPAVQRVEVPAVTPAPQTIRVERTTVVHERPTVIVRSTSHFPARAVGWVAISSGSALAIGGAVAWGVRYAIIASFNARGCLVGNPSPQVGCDTDATRSVRDIATALSITGVVTGASLAAVGTALLLGVTGDARRHSTTAFSCAPASNGSAASVDCRVDFRDPEKGTAMRSTMLVLCALLFGCNALNEYSAQDLTLTDGHHEDASYDAPTQLDRDAALHARAVVAHPESQGTVEDAGNADEDVINTDDTAVDVAMADDTATITDVTAADAAVDDAVAVADAATTYDVADVVSSDAVSDAHAPGDVAPSGDTGATCHNQWQSCHVSADCCAPLDCCAMGASMVGGECMTVSMCHY